MNRPYGGENFRSPPGDIVVPNGTALTCILEPSPHAHLHDKSVRLAGAAPVRYPLPAAATALRVVFQTLYPNAG